MYLRGTLYCGNLGANVTQQLFLKCMVSDTSPNYLKLFMASSFMEDSKPKSQNKRHLNKVFDEDSSSSESDSETVKKKKSSEGAAVKMNVKMKESSEGEAKESSGGETVKMKESSDVSRQH